jgi:hypothetical protein
MRLFQSYMMRYNMSNFYIFIFFNIFKLIFIFLNRFDIMTSKIIIYIYIYIYIFLNKKNFEIISIIFLNILLLVII